VDNFFDSSIKKCLGNVLILEDETTRPISHNQEIYGMFELFNTEKCDNFQCFITSFINDQPKTKKPLPSEVNVQTEYEHYRDL